jgi:serine/threonine protein kinase
MKYECLEKLGEGKFGQVWRGKHKWTNEIVSIKIESSDTPYKMLKHETTVLHYLHSQKCTNIPLVYWYETINSCPTLVMTYYSMTLLQYIENITLSKEQCAIIMRQMISIVKSIHQLSILHRDLKPEHFMMYEKNENEQSLHLIDFGLSTVFMDDNLEHMVEKPPTTNIIGTPKYISIHLHDGLDPSRRDDLITLGYIYIYLACGRLPWAQIAYQREKEYPEPEYPDWHILHYKNQERKALKSWTQIEQYCKIIGSEIFAYMQYVYSLQYSETPDYTLLLSFFHNP